MTHTIIVKKNALEDLAKVLKNLGAKKVLAFTGKKSFEKIRQRFEKALGGVCASYFSDFTPNPKVEDIELALKKFSKENFDAIVAIGGGSPMDFAKLFKVAYDNNMSAADCFKNLDVLKRKTPLIAIPTTAGTGAESTRFAVVYLNGVKSSFDSECALPDFALVDYTLCENSPRHLKACAASDALSHAVESYWGVGSTSESREFAKEAILLCNKSLASYVNSEDEASAKDMALAANLAGRAINITRTTAAHALSYFFTSHHGIAHGQAVALSLPKLFEKNLESKNVIDPRGVEFQKAKMVELMELLGIKNKNDILPHFKTLFDSIGLETDFKKLNIENPKLAAQAVNLERLKNNPVKLSKEELESFFA